MFCPKCATPNAGDVKFCRSCGTELEAVSLALSGKSAKPVKAGKDETVPKTAEDWLGKRIEGVSGITRGSILLLVSALIGAAMALFMPSSFDAPWIIIWSVFFGWMAVWGGIEIAYGISGVLEAKSRLRLIESRDAAVDPIPQQLPTKDEITRPFAPLRSSPPVSVTEGTTRHLDEK